MSTTELLYLAGGFLAGAAVAWLSVSLLRARREKEQEISAALRVSAADQEAEDERERRKEVENELDEARATVRDLDRRLAVAEERGEEAARAAGEQREFVEQAATDLKSAFQALAGEALKGSSEQFLLLAEQKMGEARARAGADLDERRKAIETLLAPFRETLSQLDSRTGEIERARVEAYSRIEKQIELLAGATATLEEKTTSLTTALSSSQVRGQWGEIALRNIVELAGMSAHCDFEQQSTLDDGSRPDMTVHLPGGRKIAVDAKAPLTAFMEAGKAKTEAARQAALGRHVRDLRGHVKKLRSRDYATALGGGVDLVVMFLPGDPFLGAAFSKDPELQVEALRSKVLIATPTTLVALLRTVAIYWQQQAMAENAEAIAEAARELYARAANFGDHLGGVGKGLDAALTSYNRAVGSFQRRLMPMARRLEEMKAAEGAPRTLEAPVGIDGDPVPVPTASRGRSDS